MAGGPVMTGQQRPEVLTPGEVARLFRVVPPIVTLWGRKGWITRIQTPGGAYRYPAAQFDHVYRYLRGES